MQNEILKLIRFSETPFDSLMQQRIHRVLIVCSEYDSFSLEEDGRIEEQIFNEYVSLNLRYPPRIMHADTAEQALRKMQKNYIDLVITMLNVGQKFDAFEFAKEIKRKYPGKPVVVLTPFSREVSLMLSHEDLSGIDYVFSWLGSADILLAIIKLLEDKMNVERDIKAGVQVILLVEDSIRYYSGYLTNMYKILLVQSKKFMKEGLNEHQQMRRMRGRPKIMMAKNYEEATEIYNKYKNNLLGIISDTKFPRHGKTDPDAGIRFLSKIKKDNRFLPLLLQSSNIENKKRAKELKVGFIHKYSENLALELKNFMNLYFAFGAFQFINPTTKEVIRKAINLKEVHDSIKEISEESFRYHISRNHISKWLYARALFPLADFFVGLREQDFSGGITEIRQFIYNNIANFRKSQSRGVIAEFDKYHFDDSIIFSRMGQGSLGGKARGLAFLDSLIKKYPELDKFPNTIVKIPKTVVLSTEIFDNFMEDNNLYPFALTNKSNQEILERFVVSKIRQETQDNLKMLLQVIKQPLAVRSSSVLEDSHYQPFAGVYSTYMIANSADSETNLNQLLIAIKSVYASVFYKETKAYMKATKNLIDEEKMGIVLQEVCGTTYENRFYPTFSGVIRSVNFYPIEDEKPEGGIVNVALGLGKHIVEGKRTLRFSPNHPKKILQLSSPDMALRETQKTFFALDLSPESFKASTDDSMNYKSYRIKQAEKDESIYDISSVYDFHDNVLKEGKIYEGKRIITFANILKHNSFPLADIVKDVMRICENAMNNPVEIEFAVNLNPENSPYNFFNLLQIRPIVENIIEDEIEFSDSDISNSILYSEKVLGHGVIKNIYDVIYVKPDKFDSLNNQTCVEIIERLNNQMVEEDKNYILIGPGRWGSSDPWLGIPVVWSQISAARLIVESGLENYQIEPSQGTHFFQNLTSFKVGYFTINPFKKDGFWDLDFLSEAEAVYEDHFVKHIRFNSELLIKIDSKRSKGIIIKPNDD
ncbi:MAG: phosphoenolpyruvate synthase [Bacteroidetes bacterium]|nr:MAG: phosphoenolpyruvate synthase [Bacteroidota bacterium]